LAIGTKPTCGPLVALALVTTLVVERRIVRQRLRSLAVPTVLALGLSATWYAQTWAVYGAPLYPFYRFPSGPPLPSEFALYGTSFFHDPSGSIRAATWHGYWNWTGGIAFLIIGVIVAAVYAVVATTGRERRWLSAVCAVALVELVLWGMAPFTGWSGQPHSEYLVLSGVRYLLPGLPAIALPLALLTRRSGSARIVATVLLAATLVADVVAMRHWAAPYRPHGLRGLGVVVAGALVVGLLAAWAPDLRRFLGGGRLVPLLIAPVLVVGSAAVLLVPVHGYLHREAQIRQPSELAPLSLEDVVPWLEAQPSWEHGDQTVITGPLIDALLSGPTFAHPLRLVSQSDSCAALRNDRRSDWVVLGPATAGGFDRGKCFGAADGVHLVAGYEILAPQVPG
jgi:hypothetical protein